jgi:predicted acetyltransferase
MYLHLMESDASERIAEIESRVSFTVLPVMADQWTIVAWLWQSYRNDLATVVNGFPYSDGRYQAASLDELPSEDGLAYVAWRPHPKTGEDAPIGFAVIKGLTGDRRSIEGFWVAPAVRREGVGSLFAQRILARHEGPWTIAFQHENASAAVFWRNVANKVFGVGNWSEVQRPVPGIPTASPDHFIESQ